MGEIELLVWDVVENQYEGATYHVMCRGKAFGFRSYEVLKIALFHTMGHLPEPKSAHRFCG